MTTIAVLGAGNIGATLASKWASAGHTVVIGSRQPNSSAVQTLVAGIGASVSSHAGAVVEAEVVLFALPGAAMSSTVEQLGPALDGKIVIDATNNRQATKPNSVASISAVAPSTVVARAFNSLGWENFADPEFDGTPADLFWCGPDGDAGAVAERLIADVGLRPIRLGGLDQLHLVDMLADLWFALALGQAAVDISPSRCSLARCQSTLRGRPSGSVGLHFDEVVSWL